MATYQYECESGHSVLIERPMTQEDDAKICTAPLCTSKLKRVYSIPSISFKGKGFYSTGG